MPILRRKQQQHSQRHPAALSQSSHHHAAGSHGHHHQNHYHVDEDNDNDHTNNSSSTYLTSLLPPRSSSSMNAPNASLVLDLLPPRPTSSAALLPAIPPRQGSAAPRYQSIPDLIRQMNQERQSISAMSQRRNRESRERMEVLNTVEDDDERRHRRNNRNNDEDGDEDASMMTNQAMLISFPSFHMPFDNGDLFGKKKGSKTERRKSLVERTSALAVSSKTSLKEEITAKVTTLRANTGARIEFFHEVKEKEAERFEERRQRSMEIMQRNTLNARCSTPQVIQEKLQHLCLKRDTQIEMVQTRKAEMVAEKAHRFQEMVKRANRTGLTIGDPQELEREREALLRVSSWISVVTLACRAQEQLAQLLVYRKEALQAATEIQSRHEMFVLHWDQICRLQQLYRAARFRATVRRKIWAADVLRTLLKATPRLQAQFRLTVRRTLHRICSVQRHFRAMKIIRQLRRDDAVRKVDMYIRQLIKTVDVDVNHLHKEKKQAEAQCTSAIKARKPIFEAEIDAIQKKIVHMSRRKMVLSALTETNKRLVVGDLIHEREVLYEGLLLLFGAQVMERYMVEFNIDKVYKQQQEQFEKEIAEGSVKSGAPPTVWQLRRKLTAEKASRPSLCVNITDADIQQLFHDDGTLMKCAISDFNHATEQQFGRR